MIPCRFDVVIFNEHTIFRSSDNSLKVQSKLDHLRNYLNDFNTFKGIYRYAYDFARVSSSNETVGVHTRLRGTVCLVKYVKISCSGTK